MNTQIPVVKQMKWWDFLWAKAGLYKATEIEAPEGYELAENEADRTYYLVLVQVKHKKQNLEHHLMQVLQEICGIK